MGIGAYRHRVTLDAPDGVLDPPTWYCAIQSAATQVVDGQTAFFVRGRHHAGINLETQLLFEGRTFQVQSVTDVDERHVELVLMCVEVVGRHGDSVAVVYPPPTITAAPQSSTAAVGGSVTLTVVATGRPPLTYQWLKNGSAIAGATNQFYVTGPLFATAVYAVTVTNAYGAVTSAAATVTVPTYQQQVLADGASQYWPLNDPSGTTANNMATPNPGTISGGVTLNQPGVGTSKCMTFNGTTGQIVVTSAAIPLACTVEAWVKGNDAGHRPVLCLSGESPLFAVEAKRLNVYDASNGGGTVGGSSTAVLTDGISHHIVYVLTGTTLSFYIDGVFSNTLAAVRTTPGLGQTGLGRDLDFPGGNPAGFWLGQLQDIAIYPRALTPAEIANHYATGIAR